MNFENELREALRREPAPADFAAKLMAALPKPMTVPVWRRPAAFALAAGLSIAAIVPPAVSEYRRRRDARALEAERQLITALRITNVKLRQARQRVQRATRHAL